MDFTNSFYVIAVKLYCCCFILALSFLFPTSLCGVLVFCSASASSVSSSVVRRLQPLTLTLLLTLTLITLNLSHSSSHYSHLSQSSL